ncbi:sugar transferase [Modestobacter sp. NPDC049651]|uniref:sugar transferase n=1 Tax=unclassified Modestobacter TaxID=2643866 RepID=UPI0033CD416C
MSTADKVARAPARERPPVTYVHQLLDEERTPLRRVRAWMLVVPLDTVLLVAPGVWHAQHFRGSTVMALLFLLMVSGSGRYRARLHLSVLDELPALMTKLLTAGAVVATVIALRHQQAAVQVFLVDTALAIGAVILGRVLSSQLILWSRRRKVTSHPTVLIGGGLTAAELAQILDRHTRYGLRVVGYVDEGVGVAEAVVPRLGGAAELDGVVREVGADVLLVADGAFSEHDLLDMVRTPSCLPCDLLVVPRLHHFHTQTGLGDHIGSIPIMRIRTPNLTGLAWGVKRAFDVVVVSVLLVVLAPVLVLCALAVRVEGGPGIIFRQPRVGRNGQVFDCLKFRSLRPRDGEESATHWSICDDPRVGPVGRFLRRTSFDELPQLWNILRGDMTLVGPRPERPYFVEQFSATYHRYAHRHRVRAGLTGFAQVSGLRGDTPIADRARYDNYYIENWSLWLDIKILLRTVSEVVFFRGR